MKLGMKLLAAPLLTAVAVMLSGQVNVALMGMEADKGQSSSAASLEDFKTVANVQQQLGLVHTSVYKTVALIGSLDDANVKAFRSDLVKQLDGIKRVASALAGGAASTEADRANVVAIEKQLDQYGKQADSAIDLSSVDPNTGIAAMLGADATFAGVSKTMAEIVSRSESSSQAAIAASQQRSRTTNWILVAVGLLVAGIAVWLSALM